MRKIPFLLYSDDMGFPFENSIGEFLIDIPSFSSLGAAAEQHRDCLESGVTWMLDSSHHFYVPRDAVVAPAVGMPVSPEAVQSLPEQISAIQRNQQQLAAATLTRLIREHCSPQESLTLTGGFRGMFVLGVSPKGTCWCGHAVQEIVTVIQLNYCIQSDTLAVILKFPLHNDGDLCGPGGSDDAPTETIVMIADSSQPVIGDTWLAGFD